MGMTKIFKSAFLASSLLTASMMLSPGMLLTASAEEMEIGAIYLDTQGYYAGVQKGINDRAKELGKDLKVIETNAQGDISKESSFIDRISAAQVKAIILSAVSADGSVRAIKTASKAGIPVVCYNTCVNDEAVKKYVYAYIVGDPVEFGAKLGAKAADYFIENKITAPKIGVINCEAFEVCIDRRKGFEAALKERVPGAEIVVNQEGTVLDKAITIGEQMLSSNPDLDAFFGESGGATLGAVKAVRNRDRVGKTVVFGSEVLKAVVDISGLRVGRLAFDQAMKAIGGEKLDNPITPAQIDLYSKSDDGAAWIEAHLDGIP
jgi:simple sugar transport system substrate-binding protein